MSDRRFVYILRSDTDTNRPYTIVTRAGWPAGASPGASPEEPAAAGLLLPDGHADVAGPELIAGVAEVHRPAGRIGAETIVRQLKPSKPPS